MSEYVTSIERTDEHASACDGGGQFQQHPETGMVQRVHADGTHHVPSLDPRCTSR